MLERFAITLKITAAVGALCVAAPAWAQDNTLPSQEAESVSQAGDPAPGEEVEITVTAQRREQSLQDIPMSVSAFSGEQLEEFGVTQATDIARFTPGVSATGAQGGFLQTFSIRGLTMGDYNPHQEGPIAVYRDDVYISSLQGQSFATFDSQRVEILKGPQGTLFGRNATGGLVNYISNRPTDVFTGEIDATYGTFNQRRLEAAVGGPITDGISFRVAGVYDAFDPYFDNRAGPDGFWRETSAARVQLKLEPSPEWTILLSGQIGRSDISLTGGDQFRPAIAIFENGIQVDSRELGATETCRTINNGVCTGTRPVAGGNFFGYRDPDGPGPITFDTVIGRPASFFFNQGETQNYSNLESFSLNVTHDLTPNISITSLSDYSHFKWRLAADVIGGATRIAAFDTFTDGIHQLSQELRVNADLGNLDLVSGLYFINIESDNSGIFGFLANRDQEVRYQQLTNSYSAFAQADWEFSPGLTLIAGLRFIHEEKEFSLTNTLYSFPSGTPTRIRTFNPSTSDLATSADDLWAARLGLSYAPTEDILLYATFNRGVKAGGYNQTTNATTPDIGFLFRPEVLLSYEAGARTTLADGMITANAAIFYYDYSDYQAFQAFAPGITLLVNADARVQGGEAELRFRPAQGLTFNVGASYTDAIVFDITTAPGRTVDRRPAFSPEWQFIGVARYEFPVAAGYDLFVQGDVNYRTEYFTQISNTTLVRQEGYALIDLRAGIEAGTGWNVDFGIRNVTDEIYRMSGFDQAAGFGGATTSFSRGRTFEVSVGFEW